MESKPSKTKDYYLQENQEENYVGFKHRRWPYYTTTRDSSR